MFAFGIRKQLADAAIDAARCAHHIFWPPHALAVAYCRCTERNGKSCDAKGRSCQTINIMYLLININAHKRIEFLRLSVIIITYYCYCSRNFLIFGDAFECHKKIDNSARSGIDVQHRIPLRSHFRCDDENAKSQMRTPFLDKWWLHSLLWTVNSCPGVQMKSAIFESRPTRRWALSKERAMQSRKLAIKRLQCVHFHQTHERRTEYENIRFRKVHYKRNLICYLSRCKSRRHS